MKHFPLSTLTDSYCLYCAKDAVACSCVICPFCTASLYACISCCIYSSPNLNSSNTSTSWVAEVTSTTTANLFDVISIGSANSNTWYPALILSLSPDCSLTDLKLLADISEPLGLTKTLHVTWEVTFKPTCVKYSLSEVFLSNIFPKLIVFAETVSQSKSL